MLRRLLLATVVATVAVAIVVLGSPAGARDIREARGRIGCGRGEISGTACPSQLVCSLTNYEPNPHDFSAWTATGANGPAAPSVTANQGTSPVCDNTADLVTFQASSGSGISCLHHAATDPCKNNNTCTYSVYVKGYDGGAGTLDLCQCNASTCACVPCAYTGTSWSQCAATHTNGGSSTADPWWGNDSAFNGGIARPTQSVYLWGGAIVDGGSAACSAQ